MSASWALDAYGDGPHGPIETSGLGVPKAPSRPTGGSRSAIRARVSVPEEANIKDWDMTSALRSDDLPPGEFQPVGGKVERGLIWVFIVVPTLALPPAIFFAWGGWIGWHDIVLLVVCYVITTTGIGAGYHRGFTHGSFRSKRGLKIGLAIAGSLALEGPVIRWVADHRKHHKFSDRQGDPHSPWRYGTTAWAVTKGFIFAMPGGCCGVKIALTPSTTRQTS